TVIDKSDYVTCRPSSRKVSRTELTTVNLTVTFYSEMSVQNTYITACDTLTVTQTKVTVEVCIFEFKTESHTICVLLYSV
ncbi:hypothetical protein OFD71_42520, partial [Escherichia coli]|nr:hypothetical protein [Escherichia coli]